MKQYPLLQSQMGVFLECQTYPDNTQYNLPFRVALDHSADAHALAAAWEKLIRQNAVLRARFTVDEDGIPRQWPDNDMSVDVPIRRMTESEAESYISDGFVRPFDVLGGDPLFRVELIKTENNLHMLMDFHHLIMDGFSYSSLVDRGLLAILQGREKPVDESFFKIAEEEEAYFETEEYQKSREYFVSTLSGYECAGLSDITAATGRLVTHVETIDKKTCDLWCIEHDLDCQALFQTAFALTLGRLARTDEPVFCTSYHSRVNRSMMRSAGMFVNNVALKIDLAPDRNVSELIRVVKENTEKAYSMGRFPFTHLNRELGLVPRDRKSVV